MNIFSIITLISSMGYVFLASYIAFLSSKKYINKSTLELRVFVQYVCSVLLVTLIVSLLLYFQAGGKHIMGTSNEVFFITDLITFTCFATILVAFSFDLRFFCQPVYLVNSISKLDQFFLYLRPFDTDRTGFESYIQEIARESYDSVAIANPHMVLQNKASNSIYATDTEWKDAVTLCMKKSKFNILHVGNTKGCLWELEECITNHLDKTIFIVSTKEGCDILKNYLMEIDKFIYYPQLSSNCILAFYLRDPNNKLSFDSAILQNEKDARRLVHTFISTRIGIKSELEIREKARKSPITSLFKASCFPKSIGVFSWGWLSPIAFLYVGRLRTIYSILILGCLFGGAIFVQPWMIYLTAAFIAFWGKKMMWLSAQWAGDVAMSKQTNFIAQINLIGFVISYILGKWYLSLYPL